MHWINFVTFSLLPYLFNTSITITNTVSFCKITEGENLITATPKLD